MNLEIRRRIRDNLYGSIDISELEVEVISHPIFQRLRRIRQTAFLNLVFPGASHTRMEHSLGVMHLAGLAWSKLRDNQVRLWDKTRNLKNFREKELLFLKEGQTQGLLYPTFEQMEDIFASPYILQCLRLAALLHDLGHPPFSHSGERFLPTWEQIQKENPKLPDFLKDYIAKHKASKAKNRVRHEIFTILLVDRLLGEVYEKQSELHLKVSSRDIAAIIMSDLEVEPSSPLSQLSALSLCRELISGEVDLDRMDYLRRDAKECGVAYGHFDTDRIMDSLVLYTEPKANCIHLAVQYSGLSAFEDYLRARQSMYVQLYFHKTATACEAMLQKIASCLGDWSLPASLEDFVRVDEFEIRSRVLEQARSQMTEHVYKVFQKTVDDLFLNRNLWKMVYEHVESNLNDGARNLKLESVIQFLQKEDIDFELVTSENALTKFNMEHGTKANAIHLRLIKADDRQFLRVERVEKHSALTQETGVRFHRIYVTPDKSSQVRLAIQDMLDG